MSRLTLAAVLTAIIAAGLTATITRAEEPAAPAATTAPAPQADPVAAETPAAAAAKTAATETYTPPPGFKTKKRKGGTVYCRSRAPLGTRIKSEECFTEAEIKEVERAMAVSTEDIQQRGRMCTSGFMCTGQGGG